MFVYMYDNTLRIYSSPSMVELALCFLLFIEFVDAVVIESVKKMDEINFLLAYRNTDVHSFSSPG